MSNSDSSNSKADLSGELSLLNIDVNESNNNEEKGGASNAEIISTVSLCANCGKEGDGDNMNTCNKCDLVQYCNAACKKKHKSKHKKKCERRVAALYDEKLFKEHQTREDCPICFLPLPYGTVVFKSCCGKTICNGCVYAMVEREGANILCAFCRTPRAESDEEYVKRIMKLMEKGNADAYYLLATYYAQGTMGMPQNRARANELLLKAGDLGCAGAYYNLGFAYANGYGVEIDMKKAKHYYELAAMNGNVLARNNLGCIEGEAGNHLRAMKHFILAARAGHDTSLNYVKTGFMKGWVTKEEYAQALRAYHDLEMKSEARDKAEDVMAQHLAAS